MAFDRLNVSRQAAHLILPLALVTYLATLAPGLTGGDAGELAVAAHELAAAHPPGYPLYVLLGKLATLVPLGSVAERLHAFSALCMAAAAAFLAAAAARASGRQLFGFAAGAVFAWAPLTWTWAVQLEVFALNALFAAALAWLAVLEPTPRRAAAFGAVLGLGLGNHHTLLLLGVPLLALVISERGRVAVTAAGLAMGRSLYVLLPVATHLHPAVSWGEADTLAGFWHHVSRGDYGTLSLSRSQRAPAGEGLLAFFLDHAHQLFGVGVAVAALGVWAARRRRLVQCLLAAWLLMAVGFQLLAGFPVDTPLFRSVLARFWLLPLVPACFFLAHGLAWLSRRWPRAATIAALGLPVVQLAHGTLTAERPATAAVEAYGEAVLAELPPDAILLTRGDLVHNAVRYAQRVSARRPDVVVLDQELMTYPWYVARAEGVTLPGERYGADGFDLAMLLAANPGREVHLAGGRKPGDASLEAGFVEVPHGLTTRLQAVDVERELAAISEARLRAAALPAPASVPREPWERGVFDEYWEARHRPALYLLTWLMRHGGTPELIGECVADYQALVAGHPDTPFQYYKNLGLALGLLGDAAGQRQAFGKYLEGAPVGDPGRDKIEGFLAPPAR